MIYFILLIIETVIFAILFSQNSEEKKDLIQENEKLKNKLNTIYKTLTENDNTENS